jgi:parallel beta-helix repeat protein
MSPLGRLVCTAIALAAVGAIAVSAAATPTAQAIVGTEASHVTCGQLITTDTKLDNDLVNCPNNGLVIGADDVTLDLNGHVIDGDGTEFASCPPDEPCDLGVVDLDHHGVTIKGGTIREFGFGALVVGASDSRITRLVLSNNLRAGLLVVGSSHSEIDAVTASANGLTTDFSGVAIFDSDELTIAKNAVFENGDIGFFIVGLENSRIEKNSISGNLEPEAAIILEGSGNVLSENRASGNQDGIIVFGDANTIAGNLLSGAGCPGECGFGVSLEGGSRNVIKGNTVADFHQAGISVRSFEEFGGLPTVATTVRGNLVRGSFDGVLVDSTAVDTMLEENVAIGAGDDGIDVDSAATTVTRNLALRHGDLGIEAVPGVTDGGGNKAHANGNPAQCTNVSCS